MKIVFIKKGKMIFPSLQEKSRIGMKQREVSTELNFGLTKLDAILKEI